MSSVNREFMQRCIDLAGAAAELGNGPFGALILDETGTVIAEAQNTTSTENSVIYHAEINAIKDAEYVRGKGKLSGCILYSSAEPCPMCASAIIWSGLTKVVYGASIKSMSERGIKQINIDCEEIFEKAGHKIEVTGSVLQEEALSLFDR
jgi:guanine deaminase